LFAPRGAVDCYFLRCMRGSFRVIGGRRAKGFDPGLGSIEIREFLLLV